MRFIYSVRRLSSMSLAFIFYLKKSIFILDAISRNYNGITETVFKLTIKHNGA